MDLRSLRYFVALAEELHFGRAAVRLHISQPPLSRCVKQLENDLGCVLVHRSPSGVTLTPAGAALYEEARTLLAQAERVRTRVAEAVGPETVTIGAFADSAEQVGPEVVARFRERHPEIRVRVREADLNDPTTGLRTGLVDVALTRTPFDDTDIAIHVLRSDPVGVLLRADDPLAARDSLCLADLADRALFQLPEGTDPVWRAFWSGLPDRLGCPPGPVVRTVRECQQSVLWGDAVGLMPLGHGLVDGLVSVPLLGRATSDLVVAWPRTRVSPSVRSFVRTVAAYFCPSRATAAGGVRP